MCLWEGAFSWPNRRACHSPYRLKFMKNFIVGFGGAESCWPLTRSFMSFGRETIDYRSAVWLRQAFSIVHIFILSQTRVPKCWRLILGTLPNIGQGYRVGSQGRFDKRGTKTNKYIFFQKWPTDCSMYYAHARGDR